MLEKVKSVLYHRVLAPPVARLGCRPPFGTPLSAFALRGRFGYEEEGAIKRAALRVADHTMMTFERLASLWEQVRYLDRSGIAGSLVECGVWKGGAAGMMALAHQESGPPRRLLHLCDSFVGLPEPQAEIDGKKAERYADRRASGKLAPIDQCASPRADSESLLAGVGYPSALLRFHVGWFEQTLPAAAAEIGPIALLHLDGDWYESTRVALAQLYPLVVPGGVVAVDDYGHWEGCRRAIDEYLATLDEPVLLQRIDYSGRCWVRTPRPR